MSADRETLRGLAGRVREIAELPEQRERRRRWFRHNDLKPERPLVLCSPEGAWPELLPESALRCEDPGLRRWEYALRQRLYWWDHIRDDNVMEPWFDVGWRITRGSYGVEVPHRHGDRRGSYTWDAPLKDPARDLERLHVRELSVDREGTRSDLALARELFGDLLTPRIHGAHWWTVGMTWEAAKLVGLERFMELMLEAPSTVHRLMSWLRDEHAHHLGWFEREGLLSTMSGGDGVGSGGMGYTEELRAPEAGSGPVGLSDLWGFAESQETVGISPRMFEEFVLPYQMPLLERFGRNCYGCCEPVESRLDAVMTVPRLRRLSVAPKADEEAIAAKLDGRVIFSRKPDPVSVCLSFDEDRLRADVRRTLEVAGHGPLEIILKDTHTVQGEAWRITRWVELALEEVDRFAQAHPR